MRVLVVFVPYDTHMIVLLECISKASHKPTSLLSAVVKIKIHIKLIVLLGNIIDLN